DGEIFVAARFCSFHHLRQAVLAVRCVGMAMQVATDVAQRYQLGQAAGLCGFDFATVLPELRLDVWQPDGGKYLLLRAPTDPLFTPENAILVDLEAPSDSELPDVDVVRF